MAQREIEGQIALFPSIAWWANEDDPFPPPPTGDVGHPQAHSDAWVLTGICLGTPGCLCGQRELSDDPLWNESE